MSGASAGSIDLDLGIDYGSFNQQLRGIAGNATNMVGGAFKKLGGIIAAAFAIHGMVSFSREAINLASDLQEVQNVVDVTFGSMSTEVDAWSTQMIESFGLSELSAKKYASTMGAMLKSSGLTGETMKDMSKNLTELTADMASFYNLSTDMAFDKIRAGISGETEPLKQLGINLNVANLEAFALSQGITKSYQAMSQAEQVMLRYNYLLNAAKDSQGDFARNGDSWANQLRVLTERFRIFQGTMGQGFINILTPVIGWINKLIAKLQIAANYFKAFTEVLFGAQNVASNGAAAVAGAASSMGDMGAAAADAAKDVKKAGKAVKGSLGSFDQLNTITQKTASAMDDIADQTAAMGGMDLGSGNMVLEPDINTDIMRAKVQGIVDDIRGQFNSLWSGIKSGWSWAVSTFGPSLQQAWATVAPELAKWKGSFGTMFNDIIKLGEPLKNWFLTSVVPLWQQGITTAGEILAGLSESVRIVFEDIWAAAYPILESFVTEGLPRLTEFLGEAQGIFQQLFDLAKRIFDDIWRDAVNPAMQLISDIVRDVLDIVYAWWDKWGVKILDGIKKSLDKIKEIWRDLWDGFLKPFVDEMLENLTWLWEKHLKGLVKQIGEFVGKLITAAQDIWNEFIAPIIQYLVKTLGPTFSDVFTFIGDVIGTIIGVIADVASGIFKALGGIIDFIAGVFTGDWKRAWNGIKDFMSGIGDAIVGIFKGAVNLVIDAINWMIRQLSKVSIDIPDWVPGVGGKNFGFTIPEIPKLAKGGLAYGPTLAMVGDNRGAAADPEVISPLSKLQELMGGSNQAVVEALYMILETLRSNGSRETVLKIGETELGRVAARAINSAQRQAGRSLLEL